MRSENFFKFIKYYGKGRKIKLLGFFTLSLGAGILEFLGISLVYPFILLIIKPETIITNQYYKSFITVTHQQNILINAFILGFLVMLIFIFKNLFMIFCSYLQNKFITNWKLALNKKFMKYYLFSPYKNSLNTTPSEKLYTLNFLINQTLDGFIFRIIHLFTNTVIVGMILWLLVSKFVSAAIITSIFILICLITYKKLFQERTSELARNFSKYSVICNENTMEIISNIKELKILNSEKYFYKEYVNYQEEYSKVVFKNSFLNSMPPYIVEIFVVMTLVIISGIISFQNIENTSWMIASYTVVAAAIFRIAPALNKIQVSLNGINSSRGFVKSMNDEYEKVNLEFIEPKTEETLEFKNKITFNNINFAYKTKPIIKDLNFEIKRGEFVGIIGLSGAGKSTLADIIMGLLPIENGQIFIDEKELTQENFSALRKLTGYVPQQVNLIDGSFKRNVAWGVDDNSIDEEKVIESIKSAQLWDFVNGFAEGINSKVILGSTGLSQGQKQRLAIARALYHNPQVLIFDEATSSLDVETEHEITKMLTELKGEKTIIAIAHRLSTLKSCDRLIYLKDGTIVDSGSFEELSQRHADFEKLVRLSRLN